MWDDRRKVGVLNDFDLAKFVGQAGASGQENTGTLPFMALDLLSEEGLRGVIPRRYRHEAESFTWTLVCLCLATVENEKGKNLTMNPHPLRKWFEDWESSRDAKIALQWRGHMRSDIPLVHPNTRGLACALHKYWVDRYIKQFPGEAGDAGIAEDDDEVLQMLNPKMSKPIEIPPYEEPEDENLFRELVVIHARALRSLKMTEGIIAGMSRRYKDLDWTT